MNVDYLNVDILNVDNMNAYHDMVCLDTFAPKMLMHISRKKNRPDCKT